MLHMRSRISARTYFHSLKHRIDSIKRRSQTQWEICQCNESQKNFWQRDPCRVTTRWNRTTLKLLRHSLLHAMLVTGLLDLHTNMMRKQLDKLQPRLKAKTRVRPVAVWLDGDHQLRLPMRVLEKHHRRIKEPADCSTSGDHRLYRKKVDPDFSLGLSSRTFHPKVDQLFSWLKSYDCLNRNFQF